MLKNRIKELSEKNLDNVIKLRRELHKIPELGFQEFKTGAVIKRELERLGIEFQTGVAKTGIVAIIRGKQEGKTVLLRADMDGLPIEEESRCEFKSEIKGQMHACGHDGHTSSLLGVAAILNELKDELKGNVKLIFQPAEEGPGGAMPMIEEGILENPKVDVAFGCHLWPAYKGGSVIIRDGAMMASPTSFDIVVKGKGGHASLPEKTIDPIVIGCQIVSNLQNIRSRGVSTLKPAVISCCTIKAGEAYNIIPDELVIKGTIRTFEEEVTDSIVEQIKSVVKGVTEAYGAGHEVLIQKMYPAVINNHETFDFTKEVFEDVFGEERVHLMEEPLMGSEDFGYFTQRVPSNFFLVGIRDDQEDIEALLHHPKLFWNDKNLKTSMEALAQLAVAYLYKN